MSLTPGEADRLLLFTQAQLARARRERGLRLNVPEATALIADAVCEWARDGLTLEEARDRARAMLTPADVLPEVPSILTDVRVEARFDDGTRLVVVHDPFGALLPPTRVEHAFTGAELGIRNEAPTPIGVTSHIHLAEVNPRLRLDRAAAFGHRLDAPAGTTTWIAPGETVEVRMVLIGGERTVEGNTGVVNGALDDPEVRDRALTMLRACGYLDVVDGRDVNTPQEAESAVARLMEGR
ncbi:MAG: urease subunit gamma [bacterium]